MSKIIVATGNEGKMVEIRNILKDLDIELLSLKDADIDVDVEENGKTFEENAIIKAEAICKLTGEIVMADDSGLEVDYLNGEPGIYSARYMGRDTSYTVKNNHIIDLLKDVEGDDRSCRFVCAIALAFPDGKTIVKRGTMEGLVAYEEKGEHGFGYDPIVYLPEMGKTSGELLPDVKDSMSHRGNALRMIRDELEKLV